MKHQPFQGAPRPSQAHAYRKVAVIGAGSWGTALAATLARAGVEARIWGRDQEVIDAISDMFQDDEQAQKEHVNILDFCLDLEANELIDDEQFNFMEI